MNSSKRICYVVSGDLWGGAEAQVYQLAQDMLEKGFHVFVVTLNEGVLYNKLCKLSITVASIDEDKVPLWLIVFKIRTFIKSNNIYLVHCHGFKENLLAGIACKMILSCKVVRTHHGRGVVKGSLAKLLIERFNAHLLTNKMIAVSYDLKVYLSELGYPVDKIEVIHNGVDCHSLSITKNADEILESCSIPVGSFVIGTACRIEHEKGFQYLLLATKELLDKGLPVVFVIAGSGNLQQKFQDMAEELNIADSVIFAGFQEDVSSYLNIFDLFVMMSLNEGIPLALIEAMCLGKPVVCSAVGGIPEVVTSGDNGILVPSMDYQACASACENIIREKALQVSLGENAHKRVIENFSAQKSAESTFNLYEELLTS